MLEQITDIITDELRAHKRLLMKAHETPDCYTVGGTLDVRRIAMRLEEFFKGRVSHE